jgi:hypothetical protein
MKVIDVPEVEREAYNPDRPISGLIQMQLVHLSAAEQMLPSGQRTGINITTLHTEAQAANYIGKVTPLLHRAAKAKKPKSKKKKSAGKSYKTARKPAAKSGKKDQTAKARK